MCKKNKNKPTYYFERSFQVQRTQNDHDILGQLVHHCLLMMNQIFFVLKLVFFSKQPLVKDAAAAAEGNGALKLKKDWQF